MSLFAQNSVNESPLRTTKETRLRTALDTSGVSVNFLAKSIFFYKTLADLNPATVQGLIDLITAHYTEIMFATHWGDQTFVYDWDANPAWSIANGGRGSNQVINNGQWFPDKSGHALIGSYVQINPPNPPYLVAAALVWFLIPKNKSFKVKLIRTGNPPFPPFSASTCAAHFPPPGISLIQANAWPRQIIGTIDSEDPIPDLDGIPGFPAQVIRVPMPAALGIFTVGIQSSVPPNLYNPFNLFGEFNTYKF